MADRSQVIFGNIVDARTLNQALRGKAKFLRRFGSDGGVCHIDAVDAPVIGARLGVRQLVERSAGDAGDAGAGDANATSANANAAGAATGTGASEAASGAFSIAEDALIQPPFPETGRTLLGAAGKPVVIGNIRMGFGHYRIAMAFASCAHAMGFVPYWMDLCDFPSTTASKIIRSQNELYSLGSRLSQKSRLFNALYWEPLNSEGFRQLTYNAKDQKTAELMVAPFADLPRDVPFVGTHAWTAQAAVHAGLTHVVNAIPDNWPMALHLAEGAIHTVQTPSAYYGYKMLRGMGGKPLFGSPRTLKPMPKGSLYDVGHYIDHELVANADADCERRSRRVLSGEPIRYLLTVGGAGAQYDLFKGIIEHLLPLVQRNEAALLVNVGDHKDVWDKLAAAIPTLAHATCHFGDFDEVEAFATAALDGTMEGIHAFYDPDIFAAVYSTNLLMRACDLLVTKPSELAYYPVPKLMIRRVGGHEAWGAIRAAELGDGTYEMKTLPEICAMIDCFQAEPELIDLMCRNIRAEVSYGTYDGAYNALLLAM